ncbi:PhoD-like phosphatase [Novymonas esmeraldas]|uniref:PhoD-like phosphatase n=1 Tax=Novymonas esmeraldas TaxID=1808958 RepID=A0AAW0EUN2_9TRYP
MKRRFADTDGAAVHVASVPPPPAAHGRSRRRKLLLIIGPLLVLVVCVGALLLWLGSSEDGVTETAEPGTVAVVDGWLPADRTHEVWQRAQLEAAALNLPAAHSVAMNQLLFISCNRHDRSQLYWAYMAVAAQCEMLSQFNSTAAPACRRLYAGVSPLLYTNAAPTTTSTTAAAAAGVGQLNGEEEVSIGACGSVYDSPAAALQRLRSRRTPQPGLLLDATHAPVYADADPARRLRSAPRDMAYAAGVPVDALIWLGDAIYADKRADGEDTQSLLFHHVNTMVDVGRFWRTQRDAPEYNAFLDSCVASGDAPERAQAPRDGTLLDTGTAAKAREQAAPLQFSPASALGGGGGGGAHRNVWGTWDDHDMGENDAGREYPERSSTQRFFLDFLRAPAGDPRWRRDGVYESYTVPFRDVVDDAKGWGGPVRLLMEQLYVHAICVVLLDARTFRDRPNASEAGDMLGAEQWSWLEDQLQRYATPTAEGREQCAMVLIGSGVQIILDEKPAENWAAFPGSRDRLLGLLRAYRVERVAFISGDVHMGELGADFTVQAVRHVLGYPVIEATSSGLTHSANMYGMPTFMPLLFPSSRRISLYVEKNFGALRLSLDLRRLPLIRGYLAEVEATGHNVQRTPRWRRGGRAAAEKVINATFSIFSIARSGQPVHRLNFPLSMLTYAHSAAYVDATVDAVHGGVHHRSTAPVEDGDAAEDDVAGGAAAAAAVASPASMATLQLKNGTLVRIAHYDNTQPVPLVTWSARQLQRHVFTRATVPESLKLLILIDVIVGSLALMAVVAKVLRCVQRRSQTECCSTQMYVHPSVSSSGSGNGGATPTGSAAACGSPTSRWSTKSMGWWWKSKVK